MTGFGIEGPVSGPADWRPLAASDWSRDQFRSMIDNLKEVVFQLDIEGRWTYLNRAWEEISGFSVEESLGVAYLEFVHPEDRTSSGERFRTLIDSREEVGRHERRLVTKAGEYRQMEIHASAMLDDAGRVAGASGTLTDVTERKRVSDELRDARRRLEFVLASNPAVIFAGRPGTNGTPWECTFMSDNVREVLGYSPEAFTADPEFWLTTIHPDDLPAIYKSFAEMEAKGHSTLRCRGRCADGSYRWLRQETRVAAGLNGQATQTFGCLVDETRAREVEESLKSNAAILNAVCFAARRFLDVSSWREEVDDVLHRVGAATRTSRVYIVENVGGAGEDILTTLRYEWDAEGIPRLLGGPGLEGVSYRQLGVGQWVEALSRGEPIHGLVREFPVSAQENLPPLKALSVLLAPVFTGRVWWGFIGFDDCATEREWFAAEVEALRAAAGILGAAIRREQTEQDLLRSRSSLETRVAERTADLGKLNERLRAEVAERRVAQQALADRESRFRTLIENSSDMIFVSSTEGVIEYVSPSVKRVLGYEPSEMTGRPGIELVEPEDVPRALARLQQAWGKPPGSGSTFEFRTRRKDGTVRLVEVIGNNQTGNPAIRGLVLTLRDVTDRRRLEEQFRQAQKMESMGRLAGGVAHDFNNLLTVICGYSELMAKRLPEGDPLRRNVAQIERAGGRATALVQQLLAFSRNQIVQPSVLDLNDAVADLDKMLRRLIGEDIELTITRWPKPLYISIDRTQLDQVVMNLSVNARDAMPNGGALSIAAGPHAARGKPECRDCKVAAGCFAVLEVKDTGCGVPEGIKARIFEPFFTTKEVGKGTGLGLSMVHGAVQQAGGYVCLESEQGKGATFRICLPTVKQGAPVTEAGAPPDVRGGRETILLVEDEELVRTMLSDTLQEAGYRVLEARHGEQALEVAKGFDADIHLLLTDVVMPRMSGRELAERLAELRPRTKVLYNSGYPRQELSPACHFLKKPFTPEELTRTVRAVLDGVA